MRRALTTIVLAAAVAALVAGTSIGASRATVKTRHGELGTFLVDSKGRTLYLLEADKTKKSTCYDACATNWPPLLTSGRAKAAGKARASLLATTKRTDGKTQVTYKGHPVYRFAGDHKAGDTNGEGIDAFGGEWYVLAPNGKKIENDDD